MKGLESSAQTAAASVRRPVMASVAKRRALEVRRGDLAEPTSSTREVIAALH